jgi:hypothetical protein
VTTVPAHLEDRWPCFELYNARRATWTELDTVMSVVDVLDAIDALNYFAGRTNESSDEDWE